MRIRCYRQYVYEAGSLHKPDKGSVKVIEEKVFEKEGRRAFKLSKTDRFRYISQLIIGCLPLFLL